MKNVCHPMVETVPIGFDPWLMTLQTLPAAVKAARAMRWFSKHYRRNDEVNVGAAATVATRDSFGMFTGANQNLAPSDNPSKKCAEPIGLEKMMQYHGEKTLKLVTAMVVSGTPQRDKQSGVRTFSIDSCGLDRELYEEYDMHANPEEGFMHENTIMFSVHPDGDIYEARSYYDFQALHALQATDEIVAVIDPGLRNLQTAPRRYLKVVNGILEAGKEPDRGAVSLFAITGQLPHVGEQGLLMPEPLALAA